MDITIPRDVEPDGLVVEGVPVGVEALEGVVVARIIAVHGGIVLVAEDDAGAGHAVTVGFAALAADGFLLVALEFALSARQAGGWRVRYGL